MRAHIKFTRALRARTKAFSPLDFAALANREETQQLLNRINTKKLVLTVTAGRTGTAMMARLFDLLPDVTATHEGVECYSQALAAAQNDPMAAARFMVDKKLPAIAALPTPVFAESSHLVGKGFLEIYWRLGITPHLVFLHRPLREIALSMVTRWWVPGKTKAGKSFSIWVNDPMALPLPDAARASDYQRAFWYAIEMERRMQHYTRFYADKPGHLHAISTNGLTDLATFTRLLARLQIPRGDVATFEANYREIAATRHNANAGAQAPIKDIEAQEEAVWDRIAFYEPTLRADIEGWFKDEPMEVSL